MWSTEVASEDNVASISQQTLHLVNRQRHVLVVNTRSQQSTELQRPANVCDENVAINDALS